MERVGDRAHTRRRRAPTNSRSRAPDRPTPEATRHLTKRAAGERQPQRTARSHGSNRAPPGQRCRWVKLTPVERAVDKHAHYPRASNKATRRRAPADGVDRRLQPPHSALRRADPPSLHARHNGHGLYRGRGGGTEGQESIRRAATSPSGRLGNPRPEGAEPRGTQGRTKDHRRPSRQHPVTEGRLSYDDPSLGRRQRARPTPCPSAVPTDGASTARPATSTPSTQSQSQLSSGSPSG